MVYGDSGSSMKPTCESCDLGTTFESGNFKGFDEKEILGQLITGSRGKPNTLALQCRGVYRRSISQN